MIPCLLPVQMMALAFSCCDMYGANAWHTLMTPNKLVCRTESQLLCRSDKDDLSENAGVGRPTPALAMRIWIWVWSDDHLVLLRSAR